MRVTCDIDGVLIPITEYIKKEKGITAVMTRYEIRENDMSDTDKETLLSGYTVLDNFKQAGLSEGTELLKCLQGEGHSLVLNSMSCTEDIMEYKRKVFEGYGELQLSMYQKVKEIEPTDILIEDSLENLMNTEVYVDRILIDKDYNQSENYGSTDTELGIKRVRDIEEAISYILLQYS